LPESQWSARPPADQPQEQYAWVKHQPGECQQAQKFAAVRWKNNGDLMGRYAYRVCQAGDQDSPQAVFERHRLNPISDIEKRGRFAARAVGIGIDA
jgi:hypothetical protein